ncbi:MAG: hypothetical protein ABIW17_02230 [Marmoricola sp.]
MQGLDHELDLGADPHVLHAVTIGKLAEHDDALGELDRGQRERNVGISGRDVGRRRLVLRVGVGPDGPAPGELG